MIGNRDFKGCYIFTKNNHYVNPSWVFRWQYHCCLALFPEQSFCRKDDFQQFNNIRDLLESDENADSFGPIFDQFHNQGGASAKKDLTNSTAHNFEQSWLTFSEFVKGHYKKGSGNESNASGKDIFLMPLKAIKHEGHWDVLERVFETSGPTFERMISRFAMLISDMFTVYFKLDLLKTWQCKRSS